MTDWRPFEDAGIILAIMVVVLFALALLFESFRATTWWFFRMAAAPIIWIWGCLGGLGGMLFGRGVVRSGGGDGQRGEDGNGDGDDIELEDLERGVIVVGVEVVDTEAGPEYTGDGGDAGNEEDITVSREVHVENSVGL